MYSSVSAPSANSSAGAVWYIWQKSGPQGFFTRMQPQKNTARFFDYLTEISQRILQNYRSKTMFFRHFCQYFKPNLDWNTRICQNCLRRLIMRVKSTYFVSLTYFIVTSFRRNLHVYKIVYTSTKLEKYTLFMQENVDFCGIFLKNAYDNAWYTAYRISQ